MKKKLSLILSVLLILLLVLLTACSKDIDARTVVAKVDGEKIYKSEFNSYWQNVNQQMGITEEILADEKYTDDINKIRNDVLDNVVNQFVMRIKLEEMGYYNLTKNEHDSAKNKHNDVIKNALDAKQTEIMSEMPANYTEKDYAKVVTKYVQIIYEELGITEKELLNYYIDDIVLKKAKIDLINITVTDEDVADAYDQNIARDKKLFENDIELFDIYKTQGYSSYYTPSGIRMVRHVLIKLDDDAIAQIRELRSAGDDKKADETLANSLKSIQATADEALSFLKDGSITMDEAIAEYNDDPGMASNIDGYAVSKDKEGYLPGFAEGGMALKKIGDISDLVATDLGYHIIEYRLDVKSGSIDFETVQDTLYDELLANKNKEVWFEQLQSWTSEYEVEYFYDRLVDIVE